MYAICMSLKHTVLHESNYMKAENSHIKLWWKKSEMTASKAEEAGNTWEGHENTF